MPHYFLHMRDGDRFMEDPEGLVLPDLAAARAEALAGARQLLGAALMKGEMLDGWRFEIADEAGRLLELVPFAAAIRPR